MVKLERPAGLFLGGGGALGSWQSGVLKKLVESGAEFDVLAGFSIGAVNGAAYCFDRVADLKGLWSVVKPENILKYSVKYNRMPLDIYAHYAEDAFSKTCFHLKNHLARFSLFSNEPLYRLLDNWLNLKRRDFARKVACYMISHCVERKMPYVCKFDGTKENKVISFRDATVASCAIPSVFPPVEIVENGVKKHLVDGGVIGVADISLRLFEGCKTLVIVSNSRPEDMNYEGRGIRGYFEKEARRMLFTHMRKIYDSRVFIKSKPAVHLLYPQKSLNMRILGFDGEKCLNAFESGEEEAARWLESLSS